MKLTIFFLLLFTMQISAFVPMHGQVTLKIQNESIRDVFKEIENQSPYRFFYNEAFAELNKRVNINVDNKDINATMNELLLMSDMSYKVLENNLVVIAPRKELQQQVVTGRVTDAATGEPLPGVSVLIKGTTVGVITNVDGEYRLTNVPPDAILVFSFIGMVSREVAVESRNEINITMEADVFGIEEVVTVGYGTTSKATLTASVSQIKTDDILDVPFLTIVDALAGRSTGVFAQHTGGDGALARVSIRGGGEPLYVIDGIKSTKMQFSMLPPGDIEDISILKDAAATAVYGSEAGDGIILVTTKTGKGQDLSFEYSNNIAFQTRLLRPNFLSLYEKALVRNSQSYRDGTAPVFSDELVQIFRQNTDPQYKQTDRYLETVNPFAPLTLHNLSMRGQKDNTSIYLSLNYQAQEGPFKASTEQGTDRYSIRANLSHKIEDIGLTASGQAEWYKFDAIYPAGGSGTVWGWMAEAIGYPIKNPEGNYYDYGNPMAAASDDAGYINDQTNWINTRISLLWEIPWVEGLSVNTFGNYLYESNFYKQWRTVSIDGGPYYTWDNNLPPGGWGKPLLTQRNTNRDKFDVETHINYRKTFAEDHTISLTGVYTQFEQKGSFTSAYRREFLSRAVDQLFAGSTVGQNATGSASEAAMRGWIGRVAYDYQNKYMIEFSGRYDGSDNFPTEKRWGFFPSVSAGWNIARESFFQSISEPIRLNSLKFRGSYGKTGLTAGAARFGYIPSYNILTDNYYAGGQWVPGFTEGPLVSPDFTWFERMAINAGFDFSFFDNKLTGTADWFFYRTTNYLASPTGIYSTPLGQALPQIMTNSAHRRAGAEFALDYRTRIGRVNMNIGGNISYYNQLWEKMYAEDEATLKNPWTRLTHARSYYTVGYQALGYYQSNDDLINNPRQVGRPRYIPGMLRLEDLNGDGMIDGRDMRKIGTSNFPHLIFGMNFGFNYKGFALNAFFQGAGQREYYLGYSFYTAGWKNYDIQKTETWTEDNPDAMFPVLSNIVTEFGTTSSKWLVDGRYLRLKNLSISYDLKNFLLKDVHQIGAFSIVFSGTNILTLSPLNKYYVDPEQVSSHDNFRFPVNRSFSGGLRINF